MPPQDGIRSGFSPTFYLLNVLGGTIESSLSSVAKCANPALTTICGKPRQKTIHICIDVKDDVLILALCNSKEKCARTIFVYTKSDRTSAPVAKQIISLIDKVRLNAHIEYGVCGGCDKILQGSKNIVQMQTASNNPPSLPITSLLPTEKQNLEREDGMTFSKKFGQSVKMGPGMTEVYQYLLNMADDKEAASFVIEDYRKKIQEEYMEDSHSRILGQIGALRKKGIVEKAGHGNIKVYRVMLEGAEPTTEEAPEESGEAAMAADQTEEPSVEDQRRELLENCHVYPSDNIVSHLLQELATAGNSELDLKSMTKIIMEDTSLQGLILQARLKLLGQMIGDHPACPQVTEDDDGHQVILFKI